MSTDIRHELCNSYYDICLQGSIIRERNEMQWVPSRSEYISKIVLPSHNPLLLRFPLLIRVIVHSRLTPMRRWQLRTLFTFISKTHRSRTTTITSNVSYPQLTSLLLQPFPTFGTFK